MELIALLVIILSFFLAVIISSLPLYLSVKLIGGRCSIFSAFFTNMLMAFLTIYAAAEFGFGAIILVIITILVYMLMFRVGIIRAFFVWIIQYFVAALLVYLALLAFGTSIPFGTFTL